MNMASFAASKGTTHPVSKLVLCAFNYQNRAHREYSVQSHLCFFLWLDLQHSHFCRNEKFPRVPSSCLNALQDVKASQFQMEIILILNSYFFSIIDRLYNWKLWHFCHHETLSLHNFLAKLLLQVLDQKGLSKPHFLFILWEPDLTWQIIL